MTERERRVLVVVDADPRTSDRAAEARALKPVFESLDLVTLQTLNARIQVEGIDAKEVARGYLEKEGFLK